MTIRGETGIGRREPINTTVRQFIGVRSPVALDGFGRDFSNAFSQMPSPNASQIASLLREFGRRAMLYGGNPYRAKAYLRAADSVAMLTEPIGELIAKNKLLEIPGVGEAIAGVIATLFETGSHPSLEKMRADVPDSVLEMLTIPGLRPEKVLKLHKELGIDTIDELEVAAKQDRLKGVKGLGPALQRKILAGSGNEAKLTRCEAHPSRRRPFSDSQRKS